MIRLILVLLVLAPITLNAQVRELSLVSDTWPPFTNVANEKAFATELVNEALMRSYIRPKQTIENFGDVLTGIKQGKFDGSAALWKSPEREEYLLFSRPYLQNQLVLVGRSGSDVSAASLSELGDKKVAIVSSYAYGNEVSDAASVNFVKGANDQENLQKLVNEEVDYMLVDALLIQYVLKHQQDEASEYLAIGETPLITKSLYFAINKEVEGAEEIIKNFNEEIVKMIADGTYNRILNINQITSDINGDGVPEVVLNSELGAGKPAGVFALEVAELSNHTL